ncbi:MAG: hypothetical protein PSV46_04525 [Reyranella sp.]|nr:hypothetical protein [Reyranella sp.]
MARAKTSTKSSDNWILAHPFRHDGGMRWAADLPPELSNDADNNEQPYRSPLRLLEDGTELGPGHALHASARIDWVQSA